MTAEAEPHGRCEAQGMFGLHSPELGPLCVNAMAATRHSVIGSLVPRPEPGGGQGGHTAGSGAGEWTQGPQGPNTVTVGQECAGAACCCWYQEKPLHPPKLLLHSEQVIVIVHLSKRPGRKLSQDGQSPTLRREKHVEKGEFRAKAPGEPGREAERVPRAFACLLWYP